MRRFLPPREILDLFDSGDEGWRSLWWEWYEAEVKHAAEIGDWLYHPETGWVTKERPAVNTKH